MLENQKTATVWLKDAQKAVSTTVYIYGPQDLKCTQKAMRINAHVKGKSMNVLIKASSSTSPLDKTGRLAFRASL